MIFEMTNNYSIILPLMTANISAYALATRLQPAPIYDALLAQDNIHLPHTQKPVLRQVQVQRAMTDDVTTVSAALTVNEAFAHVQSLPVHHHAYPVLDEAGGFAGLFTFNDLKRAIAAGKGDDRITEILNREIIHAHPDHTLDVALVKLGRKGVSQLPVISRKDPTRLLGIITMHDIATALSDEQPALETTLHPATRDPAA
jgi:CIC family chloride channel protein